MDDPHPLRHLDLARSCSRVETTGVRELKEEIDTDVVIVGGGLTGCLAACQFARAGVKAVLVEADKVVATAALDAGWIVDTPGVSFRELQQLHGLRSARRAYELSRRAALDVAAFLRRLAINCDLEPRNALLVATSREGAPELEREHQARVAAGLDAAWLPARRAALDARTEQARGAIKTHSEGTLDPFRACLGIVAAAVKAGRARLRALAGRVVCAPPPSWSR